MATDDDRFAAAIAVTRFGLGARSGEIAEAASDPRGWLAAQIRPEGAEQPPGAWPAASDRLAALAAYRAQLRALRTDLGLPVRTVGTQPLPSDVQQRLRETRRAAFKPIEDEALSEMLARGQLAVTTSAGFRERWALFWSNHLSVGAKDQATGVLGPAFEREAIRPNVFGRFETLLVAAVTHQAMLHYLDQARSAGPDSTAASRRALGLNENLAREVLELHTVGADAGYTQADVTEFARALTGYSIATARDGGEVGAPLFRAGLHEPGPRTVMGRTYADAGPGQASAILADLAASPATARHLARKIAAHLVADVPPAPLTACLESAYLASGGDLARVAEALIAAPEAWSPGAGKLKTPYEFLISSWRASSQQPADARGDLVAPLTAMGMRPFAAPQPNGWPDQATAWGSPDAVIKRLTWSQAFAEAKAPAGDPVEVARSVLGTRLTPEAARAIGRAESRPEAFALLLMTPEFQRR